MRRVFGEIMWISVLFTMLGTAAAQSANPAVQITFPPPVYELSGTTDIIGTANTDGQTRYFFELRPLSADTLEPVTGAVWAPATLPFRGPRPDEGALAALDTTAFDDGLYALRLVVQLNDGDVLVDVVTPLRINNADQPSTPLDEDADINQALLALTATASTDNGVRFPSPPPSTPNAPVAPTPTALPSGSGNVTATVLVVANLRAGDGTTFNIIDGLMPGTALTVVGRSDRGNNWLQVDTSDGTRGWVAPSVVQLDGNLLSLPRVESPATPTPIPSPTPNLPDANVRLVEVDRNLREDESFQVLVTIRNDGAQFLPQSQIFCNVEPVDTEVTFTGGGLQPGAQRQFVIPLRLESGGGNNVTLICEFDPNNQIAEISRNNNRASTVRFLEDD